MWLLSQSTDSLQHISSGRVRSVDHFLHSRRTLNTFVLLIGIKGTLYITQDDLQYELSENQYLILFPGHTHYGYQPSSNELSYFWCHFTINQNNYELVDDSTIHKLISTSHHTHSSTWNDYMLPEYGTFNMTNRTTLLFRQLLDFSHRWQGTHRSVDYALSLLVLELSRSAIEAIIAHHVGKVHYKVIEISDWIRNNYTGYPLRKYINHTKILAAKKLLLESSLPIKVVALEVGFQDDKTFMKVFKQFEELTPSQYRNAFHLQKINK